MEITEQPEQPDDNSILATIRRSRGAQLRALILSWQLGETYQRTLQIQAEELQSGELVISDDWAEIAESILGQFAAQKAEEE